MKICKNHDGKYYFQQPWTANKMRPSGIEPEAIAWEAMILPLNQERGVCGAEIGELGHQFRALSD
jgi:hypothetical protein